MAVKLYDVGTNPKIVADALASIGSSGLIFLQSDVSTAANNYGTLRTIGGSQYQVTAGKTLWIDFAQLFGAAGLTLRLGYADTAVSNSASNGTSGVIGVNALNPTANQCIIPVHIPVPAAKFPVQLMGATALSGWFYCHEE